MYRIVEVKNAYDPTLGQPRSLFVLQKSKLFGGWKYVCSSSYRETIYEKFYFYVSDKRPEDEVLAAGE